MAVYQAVHPGISHDQNWPLAIMGIGPRVELETSEFLLPFGLGQDERVGCFEHGHWTAPALTTTKVFVEQSVQRLFDGLATLTVVFKESARALECAGHISHVRHLSQRGTTCAIAQSWMRS